MALDVKDGSSSPATPIITWPRHGNANQRWRLQKSGSEFFIASELGGNLVLDIKGGDTGAEAPLIVYPKKPHGNDNQQWKLVESHTI